MNINFSIAIPSYNRARQLELTLDTISQKLGDFTQLSIETIVILDGSTDDSEDMLHRIVDTFPVPLRYKWQANQGLATTRNRLIQMARGKIVWLLDDDIMITQNAVRSHFTKSHNNYTIRTGPFSIVGSKGLEFFYEERWKRLVDTTHIQTPSDMSFANTSFQRDLLLEHPFCEEFKTYGFEDYELAARLLKLGIDIEFCKDALVTHNYDKSDFFALKNQLQEGENRVLFANLHPEYKSIAYDLNPRKYRKILMIISNQGMHRSLWGFAVILFIITQLLGIRGRLSHLSHDCALHGGIAKAGGIFERV